MRKRRVLPQHVFQDLAVLIVELFNFGQRSCIRLRALRYIQRLRLGVPVFTEPMGRDQSTGFIDGPCSWTLFVLTMTVSSGGGELLLLQCLFVRASGPPHPQQTSANL
jgi:hypothetical protein